MSALSVGFCGLGRMGLPMARRLLEAGHTLYVWNRTREKAQTLPGIQTRQCVACASPVDVARAADIVMLCLTDGPAVEEIAFGAGGLAESAGARAILVDHSTIAPSLARSLAARWHAETGGAWIDAPVSGGTAGAAAGTLAIMAGGPASSVRAIEPIVAAYAARLTRMGESGAGQATKLANQTIVMTTIAAIAEATRLAQHSGIDVARVPEALQGGWADSVLLQTLLPRMLTPPAQASGTIRTMLKDLDAIQALAHEGEVALPVSDLVRRWLVRAVETGWGEADISQIVRVPIDA